ncbi:STM4012 family radical SAM protein [Cerasicoccus arenae]|uniref:Coproporphyrinogen III oxidase n=1 Tax=Cerasicoccus arenae TaxID=424488 RepID=A0A8J3GDR1_9BACT|nr:STM4012 family radical SAM protein [Cerasicoccus arenae]MBK1859703.1 STM4012 family radical SAM protein [Cerasicoccus arenae]GHC03729.1 coproporphyrinogen III oxidase [Cerasicoccus arenae]
MIASQIEENLRESPYTGYAYAYPHKTVYEHFAAPIPLHELWSSEDQSQLFLYVHLPFCEMRCGFCNLFTTTHIDESLVDRYLDALDNQLRVTAQALNGPATFSRAAFGGGTPSFLSCKELDRLFNLLESNFGAQLPGRPISFEFSPQTVESDKARLLRERGITRASLGVQSFLLDETKKLGRPQDTSTVHNALNILREAEFPVVNIDLIYGIVGQTVQSWLQSLEAALSHNPQELYIYPLYVRPLTGLNRANRQPTDNRLELYRMARDLLLANDYQQISMRLFRKRENTRSMEGPVYCCQEDGMVGIGAGARSYTTNVHYCTEYAVGKSGISTIINDFIERTSEEHAHAVYGCELGDDDQQRRYIIKSLLRIDGLDLTAYQRRFSSDALSDLPQLRALVEQGLAHLTHTALVLNTEGMELSDSIGPWLYSPDIKERISRWQPV